MSNQSYHRATRSPIFDLRVLCACRPELSLTPLAALVRFLHTNLGVIYRVIYRVIQGSYRGYTRVYRGYIGVIKGLYKGWVT